MRPSWFAELRRRRKRARGALWQSAAGRYRRIQRDRSSRREQSGQGVEFSLQRGLHFIDDLALFLPFPLSIHVGTRLLDHCETLHARHVVLQEGLFGLKTGGKVE